MHAARAVKAYPAPVADAAEESASLVLAGGAKGEKAARLDEVESEGQADRQSVAWLGIVTDEAPEVLTAQLGLEAGVGLVVTYVTTNSPAAKAGLKKNDVLVLFNNQSLVHPAQLRKLVRTQKEGDEVKLTYYRSGKKETVSATLGKRVAGFGLLGDEDGWRGNLQQWKNEFHELPIKEALHEQLNALRQSLGNLKIDQQQVQTEVRHSMQQARKAMQDSLRGLSNVDLGPTRRALEELARSGVSVDDDATVTVRSMGKSSKSIVKADDTGTLVIVANPKLRLTAHDKEGKLLFDGEIQTSEERAKVPQEVMQRVEPLLKRMNPPDAEEAAPKDSE